MSGPPSPVSSPPGEDARAGGQPVFSSSRHPVFDTAPREHVHYFGGIDPAPAFGSKNDDGALVAARVFPFNGKEITSNPADWYFQYVWAYRLRGASIREWSGFIHKKHRDFVFTRLMIDPQAGGGGPFIVRELASPRQLIDQIETEVQPIRTLDAEAFDGQFILHLFRRKDPAIAQMWQLMKGDDNLIDTAHTTFRTVIQRAGVAFPPPYEEIPREITETWPEEMQWAIKLLAQVREQLKKIQVATNPDSTWALTGNGAKQYSAVGRKDMAYAALYCYLAFLCWLQTADLEAGTRSGKNSVVFF